MFFAQSRSISCGAWWCRSSAAPAFRLAFLRQASPVLTPHVASPMSSSQPRADRSTMTGYRICNHRVVESNRYTLAYTRCCPLSTKAGDDSDGLLGKQRGADTIREPNDGLVAALVEELVWKGDDDDEEEEEENDEEEEESGDDEQDDNLQTQNWDEILEGDGSEILFMGHEDPEEVRKQMERQWGTLTVEDTQETYRVDTVALEDRLRKSMEVLGCQSWDVGVVLTTDKEVSQLNAQYRNMEKSTDILSFSMHDMSTTPGILPKVRHPAEMDLGDMYISLAYVDRQIALDREDAAAAEVASVGESAGEEWPLPKDRGVSGAMADVFDLQERVSMLLVHGLLHLLGYDHETDDDYEAMVAVEEGVLEATRPVKTAGRMGTATAE